MPVLKARCVKCHGPGKAEAGLNLSTPAGLVRGGESGPAIAMKPAESLLWQRVAADEMPPEEPLEPHEREVIERWLAAGAKGLPTASESAEAGSDHWAFARMKRQPLPAVQQVEFVRSPIDHFILAELERQGLSLTPEASRQVLVRRVAFDLTGLPPTLEEIEAYVSDRGPNAYERMVERYLASPHYGERWGKFWLDAAGYADSNGYFNADSDRPLAYRYRDYVVRAFNADMPLDRFILEQLAGDELSGFVPGGEATDEVISLLEATHYLRNGQDGTGESDGNADEVRSDRYFALESTMQIVCSSLLGLTMQCAKCHDHKFEPISQREYYQLQSVFYPAYNADQWLKPNERIVEAPRQGELAVWEARSRQIDASIAAARSEFASWTREHRPSGTVLFQDDFDARGPALAEAWSNQAPGDDSPAGTPAVQLDSQQAPAAWRQDGALAILEVGGSGDRCLSTQASFDWTPDENGAWIQVTFDLVANHHGDGKPAERIAYLIALRDFNDRQADTRGNLLIDGNPAGGAAVHVDYPGRDSHLAGDLGAGKYEPGHNYGVRVTNTGDGKFRLEHLVDGLAEDKAIMLDAADLADGGFGFEYCCGRSFAVDNVRVERNAGSPAPDDSKRLAAEIKDRQKKLAATLKDLESQRGARPGRIAWVTDRSAEAPDVFLLERGNHAAHGEKVRPMALSALSNGPLPLEASTPFAGAQSTGRRLAWARWLTQPGSRQVALLARVQANRIWQHHFGAGIVTTAENLGTSGAPPSHPELLDFLGASLIHGNWSAKSLHRQILVSATYRQASEANPRGLAVDRDNRLLWRYSLRRLDGEALRDAMLATSGQLDRTAGGPYVPTTRDELGEVLVKPGTGGENRRSLYLQQRRTQMLSMLNVFDTPTIVFNCVQRPTSTMPLQSLSLMNSEFVVRQAAVFAARLATEAGPEPSARVRLAYHLALAREASEAETADALEFVAAQAKHYDGRADAGAVAWSDFCQMLLASNVFLYVE